MYNDHRLLLKKFQKARATVENGKVVNPPSLVHEDYVYHIESVRETTDLTGKTSQQVILGNKDRHWLAFSLDYENNEWSLTMSLADKLNHLNVTPDCNCGQVSLEKWDEETRGCVPLTEAECDWLELDEGSVGTVEAHPEGADRGGYVPTLDAGPIYCEGAGEWQDG